MFVVAVSLSTQMEGVFGVGTDVRVSRCPGGVMVETTAWEGVEGAGGEGRK